MRAHKQKMATTKQAIVSMTFSTHPNARLTKTRKNETGSSENDAVPVCSKALSRQMVHMLRLTQTGP